MRRFLILLSLLSVVFNIELSQGKENSKCLEEEYFSNYSNQCEKSILQLGFGEQINSFDLNQLSSVFPLTKMRVQVNPAYEKTGTVSKLRNYTGFKLKDVIRSLLPATERLEDYILAVTCLDGFDPVIDFDILKKIETLEAVIAYKQDTSSDPSDLVSIDGKWEPIQAPWGIVSPGPFYLVWGSPEGTYWKGWPFQIKSLRLIKASDYQKVAAKLQPNKSVLGLNPKSSVEEGFNQFKGKCLTCHSVQGVGGKKAQVNLLDRVGGFKTRESSFFFLKAVIQNPPAGMMDIKDIKIDDEDIKKINDYLRHMNEQI